MVIKLIDSKIRQAFSDAALHYDVLTSLHKEIGRELVKKTINIEKVDHILDIGMGTGWLTNKLKFYFPDSVIVGIDFAPGMIDAAKEKNDGFKIVQADCHQLPFQENTFDLVISNLAFQWSDVRKSLKNVYDCLKPDGKFVITMFGFKTFHELFLSLEAVLPEGKKPLSIYRLPMHSHVSEIMQALRFKDVVCNYEYIKVRFPDMFSILRWIKNVGANSLERNFFVGKELLEKADSYYNDHFKDKLGVYATFEVLWLEGKK